MADWIISFMQDAGYLGIALLMFLENVFPPIPSELIMPLAGFAAEEGRLTLVGVIAAGSAGSLASTFIWYEVGRRVGAVRMRDWCRRGGRWLGLSPDEFDGAVAWFRARSGAVAVMLGRLVPGVRTLISVPAGVAHMPLSTFFIFSAIGTVAWTAALAVAGYVLGAQFRNVEAWLDPVSTLIVGVAVVVYVWRVVRWTPPVDSDPAPPPQR